MCMKFGVLCFLLWCLGSLTRAAVPTITSFIPTVGVAGTLTVVTINGTNFTGATVVTFNGVDAASFTVVNDTTIKATVPIGATKGTIAVTTAGGMVNSATNFTENGSSRTNPKDKAAMVWVPGGTFTMGSSLPGDGVSDGGTQQVTLSGFWIYTNEVTVAQYLAFCEDTGRQMPDWPPWDGDQYSWADKTGWPDMPQHPIINVSWYDAQAYAAWAGVTLPTEAQWEFAVRGPLDNNYPWGGTATAADLFNGWDQTKCANYRNSYLMKPQISTWPVDSFPSGASWCGAQDLAGNVWEWCADWYGNYSPKSVTNPTGPAKGNIHVLRGGSWNDDGRSVFRGALRGLGLGLPDYRSINVGFRCVALLPGP